MISFPELLLWSAQSAYDFLSGNRFFLQNGLVVLAAEIEDPLDMIGRRVKKEFVDGEFTSGLVIALADTSGWFIVDFGTVLEEVDTHELLFILESRVRVEKTFNGENYLGSVTDFDSESGLFFVAYDDGDEETLTLEPLFDILVDTF